MPSGVAGVDFVLYIIASAKDHDFFNIATNLPELGLS
jgi:hypothetical protein